MIKQEENPNESIPKVQPAENVIQEVGFKFSLVIFIVIALVFIGAIVFIVYFLVIGGKKIEELETQTSPPTQVYSAATSMPFKELTIPYLSSREYKSSLEDLDQISTNTTYTSYLTSYDSDGLKINALITQPKGDMPQGGWPAIVFVHGYIPPTTYQTNGDSYSDCVDYLARNGFVVFKIDLRGHGESEGEPGGAYYSGDYIIDTLNARAALQNTEFVNKDRVGLWGHSMAGNVIFRSFVAAKNIPAISIWAGAVYTYEDMQEFGIEDNSYRPPADDSDRQKKRDELFREHGSFDKDNEFWKAVVPVNFLDGVKGSVQINHAVNDDVVNIGYSRGLDAILNNSSINHELNEYTSGGHNITGGAFNNAMQDTVRFFRDNL